MQTADRTPIAGIPGHGAGQSFASAATTSPAFRSAETAGPAFTTADVAGLSAMADALVASGRLTRESATQMLRAEIAAHDSAHQDALESAAPLAAPTRDAHGRWTSSSALATDSVRPDAARSLSARSDASHPSSVRPDAAHPSSVRPEPVEGRVPHRSSAPDGSAKPRTDEGIATPEDNGAESHPAADPEHVPDPNPTPLAEIEIDPLFAPPETPAGYHLTLNPAVKMDVAEVQAVRGWFHTLRLPQPIAQSIYSEVERMSMRPPDEAAITRMNASTMSELTRAWGERTPTMMGHARRLIDEAAQTHPYLKTALSRGPGSHPAIVRQLAEHAARLYDKPRGKPSKP